MSLTGVGLAGSETSDGDFKELREAGVAQVMEVDGRSLVGMQTTAGTSMMATRRVMDLRARLDAVRADEAGWLDEAARLAEERVGQPLAGAWEAAVHEGWVGAGRGGCFVPLTPLP
jgi:hypothetical protein